MQNSVKPFGPALHNIFCFSCGPMEKIIAHTCYNLRRVVSIIFQRRYVHKHKQVIFGLSFQLEFFLALRTT